uniref:Glycosyltransferase n=1 Tax=Desulfatirhabdium butyrativorans TaxID=340467 RepID=A0A7C4W1L7_9BACT
MEILIAVITYNGEATIKDTVDAVLAMDANVPVLIIDNASLDGTISAIEGIISPRIRCIRNDINKGVGAAFNEALRQAKSIGAEWLMLLDQDSQPGGDALSVMLSSVAEGTGALFPTVRCRSFPNIVHYPMKWTGMGFAAIVPAGDVTSLTRILVDTGISSGALYRVAAIEDIGGFNEGYFIDFVDHECHLRLKAAGYGLYWVRNAEIWHNLGRIHKMTDSGLWIEHEPFRYYYMGRNMIQGYWRFGGIRAIWGLIGEIREHTRRLRTYSVSAADCISWLRLGVLHGVLGKTGKLYSHN